MGLLDGKVAIVTGAGGGHRTRARARARARRRVGARERSRRLARRHRHGPQHGRTRSSRRSARRAARPRELRRRLHRRGRRGHPEERARRVRPRRHLVNNAGILRDKSFANTTEDPLGHRRQGAPEGHLLRDAAGLQPHEGRGAGRRDHQHLVHLGPQRQLRPVQLRRGQGRHLRASRAASRSRARSTAIRVYILAPVALTRLTEDLPGFDRTRR